jgi:hypothetical protein
MIFWRRRRMDVRFEERIAGILGGLAVVAAVIIFL